MSNMEERKWKNPNEILRMRKRKVQKKPPLTTENTGRESGSTCNRKRKLFESAQESSAPKRSSLSLISDSALNAKNSDGGVLLGQPVTLWQDSPLDWSLKTKARFISSQPFSWTASMRTQDEADGLAGFVKGSAQGSNNGTTQQSSLKKELMVWMHPSLPFLEVFPRMETKRALPMSSFSFSGHQDVIAALREKWSTSFMSVFHMLRGGHCPYFYLCANHLTVLFVSPGGPSSGGCSTMSAMLTPTTSGIRHSLSKEGVEYTLPNAPPHYSAQKRPTASSSSGSVDSDSDDNMINASSWLQSMGLLTSDHISSPTADSNKISLQQPPSCSIDNRPESLVRVEGPSVNALFNYLLNSRSLVTSTGPHAGVPPTILAPTAFEGASLQGLKCKQGSLHEQVQGKLKQRHYFDISGPILPQALQNLSRMFHTTQDDSLTLHVTNIQSTVSFNSQPSPQPSTN